MKLLTRIFYAAFALACIHPAAYAQYMGQSESLNRISPVIAPAALSFDLSDVRLLDGPFKNAMEIDQKWLRELNVPQFLHSFRVNAGVQTGGPALGGWESLDCEVRGHSLGHILSAMAQMYASTGDDVFKSKGSEIVSGLAECQKTIGPEGYLSAFPEYFIDRAIQGPNVWAPWYTLHKMYAGLFDQYVLCGNTQALDVLMRMCDWAYDKTKMLDKKTVQTMLLSEFGGMPEVMYNIYALTGDMRCLKVARLFYHDQILNPLAAEKDSLAGIHVNTQVPKVIGEARGYELTGDGKSRTIAEFFWNTVVHDHTYVTGGNSENEIFNEPGKFSDHLGLNTTETCNTYNMLKLTRHLFTWEAKPEYADYYERALYNHILSSQDPVSGGVTYYHTLHPGSAKYFHLPYRENTCCVGTGYENHAKYGEAIYYRTADDNGLYVNLFIASELNWAEKGLTIRQETSFPDEASTELHFADVPEKGVKMALNLRYPSWAVSGVTVKVNGRKQNIRQSPGSYICIERTWRKGDVVTMEMPMSLRVEFMPDNPSRGAVLYGPIVLAADLGKVGTYQGDASVPHLKADVTASPEEWLEPEEGETLVFRTKNAGSPDDFVLRPLFRLNDRHYTVYLDFLQ